VTEPTEQATEPAEDDKEYVVVSNHEEQYSIWPAARELPAGWKTAGPVGSKDECLDYIEEVWTDMRPLSLRQALATEQSFGGRQPARER